jgi:hypothetical protein
VNSGEVYLLGPFDERFSPIAPISVVHVHRQQNRFIRQRKLDDAGNGDGITFESTNSTNSTDECSLVLDMLGTLQDSLANPNIIEFEEVPDGVVVYEYQRTVIVDGVVVMGFYVETAIDGK